MPSLSTKAAYTTVICFWRLSCVAPAEELERKRQQLLVLCSDAHHRVIDSAVDDGDGTSASRSPLCPQQL